MSSNLWDAIFAEKEAPAAAGKTSPGYHSQMALAIFVIGHSLRQFELRSAMPSQNHNLAGQPAIYHDLIHGL